MSGKKILYYFFIAAILFVIIGFFITFEGYKPKPPQNENTLSAEQLASIKEAGQDKENLQILGDNNMQQQAFDGTNLFIEDEKIGGGAEAKAGDKVTVHYTGWLLNGTKFDSSLDRGQPFSFKLGAGDVIAGWDQGIVGMKVGGKRKLAIPASLGYGASGFAGVIPPNAALIFEVELLEIN